MFLEYDLSSEGFTPDTKKIQAIMEYPRPTTIVELRRSLEWTLLAKEPFKKTKHDRSNISKTAFLSPTAPLVLTTAASFPVSRLLLNLWTNFHYAHFSFLLSYILCRYHKSGPKLEKPVVLRVDIDLDEDAFQIL
ncbi:hypothetical protein PV326_005397 [Microctonus aethiopoides]|nr:hypothetical protein PV326_005397 [Microctonus aethiopoides]